MLTWAQSNILVDDASHPWITDFSQATVIQCSNSIQVALDDQGYNARWTAPEILTEEGTYSKEADVFSFAMIMIEVCYEGSLPISTLLIDISYKTRCSLVQFHLMIAYLLWLCWQ